MQYVLAHIPYLVGLAVLLALSAFFSGSETALFSLRREDLRAMEARGGPTDGAILALLRDSRQLLITVLFGNMIVNVLFFSFSYRLVTGIPEASRGLEAGLVTASLLTVLIFGEVTPKGIAVLVPVTASRLAAWPLFFFEKAIFPVRWLLSFFTGAALILSGRREREPYVNAEELKMLIALSEEQGGIDRDARTLMQQLVDFGRIKVKEVMVPRVDVALFDLADPVEEFCALAKRTRHTRIPVYEGSIDEIRGVVDTREALLAPPPDLRPLIQPVAFVPDTKTIESLLQQFREERRQMAIVVDEYGGTEGLVTIEDVIEELFGEIEDEFDREEPPVQRVGEDVYLLSGDLSIRDWGDLFGVTLRTTQFETVAGLVMALLGHVPAEGETAEFEGLTFTVHRMRRRRVTQVRVELAREGDGEGGR